MVLQQPERDRVRAIIKDTITLLCRNSLNFKSKFSIEAVIGVTLDDDEVLLISMNEIVETGRDKRDGTHIESSDNDSMSDGGKGCWKRARIKRELSAAAPQLDDSSRDTDVSCPAGDDGSLVDSATDGQERVKMEVQVIDDNSNDVMFVKEEVSDPWLEETLPNNGTDNNSFREYAASQSDSRDLTNRLNSASFVTSLAHQSYHPQQQQQQQRQQKRLSLPIPLPEQQSSITTDGEQANTSQNMVVGSQATSEFKCNICRKVCSNKSNMRRHERAHYGIYPYRCSVCDKGFFSQDNLKAHLYVHTGIAQFRCELCDQNFRYKEVLKHHINTRHGNEQQSCVQSAVFGSKITDAMSLSGDPSNVTM